MRTRKRRQGFTLIEVMLVLMILVGLGAVAVFTLGPRQEKANIRLAKLTIQKLEKYLGEYKLDMQGRYPTEEEGGLMALVTKPTFDDEKKGDLWGGPYGTEAELTDVWGNAIKYELTEDGKAVHLSSNGPDGEPDTEDDIKNWSDEES